MSSNNLLMCDKKRPEKLKDLTFHNDLNECLFNLSKNKDLPDILIYGPNGSGKNTRIYCFLNEIYGLEFEKKKIQTITIPFGSKDQKNLQFVVISSENHIEINLNQSNNNIELMMKYLLEIMDSYENSNSNNKLKIIIVHGLDKINQNFQNVLKRPLEKKSIYCRLIIICSSISNIIDPIKSRCLCLRISHPNKNEIYDTLLNLCKEENILCSEKFLENIIKISKGNLRKAIMTLESNSIENEGNILSENDLKITEYEKFIKNFANYIISSNHIGRLLYIRSTIKYLLSKEIPAQTIIKDLCNEIKILLTDNKIFQILIFASNYDIKLKVSLKPEIHLEAFILDIIKIINISA